MEKDKYSESLVIKLCERLMNSLNLLELKNSSLCLSEININEKGLRKILESFEGIKKTLSTAEVNNNFKNLLTKLRRSGKSDHKSLIDELEQKINTAGEDIYNPEEVRRRNI
jgi:condensin complex subunit 1